jgi:hypothetical protein
MAGRPGPWGVSARVATLRLTRSLASACRMARLSARCPMLTAAVEYPAAIAASAWRTSAAVRSRSLGADDCQDRLKDVLVLPDRLAERPSSPVASQSSAACQTVS